MDGLDALARAVRERKPGSRNCHLYWAAMRAVEEDYPSPGIVAALRPAALASGLGDREARATIRSAIRRAELEGKRGTRPRGGGRRMPSRDELDALMRRSFPDWPADLPTDDEGWEAYLALSGLAEGEGEPLSVRGDEMDTSPPRPLLLGRLDPTEPTILFGPGGVGKGALACSWIKGLTDDGHVVYILDYEDHEGEWGRRLKGIGTDLARVRWVPPFRRGLGGLLSGKASLERLKADMDAQGATYLVVDSIVIACAGSDVMDAATPPLYAEAIQFLGRPSLHLAHVTKAHDVRYPFGSVFWHNLARMTWSLSEKGGETILANQKASNYRRQGAQSVECLWIDGILRDVSERPAAQTLLDRIAEALGDGPLTPKEIADALSEGLPPEERIARTTVAATLSRHLSAERERSRVTAVGEGRWGLRDAPAGSLAA